MEKLRVYWFPQIPCKPFRKEVKTLNEAKLLLDALAEYDLFLLNNNHRCDYANTGGLQYFDEEEKEWLDWYDDDGNNIDEHFEQLNEAC